MMRLAILAPLLAAVAGCAPTQEVLRGGQRYEYVSGSDSRKLASCTAFNASKFDKRFIGEVQPLVRPEAYQVVVTQVKHWHFEPIIVAHATPGPAGSQIVVFVSNELPPPLRADWIERLRKGCDELRPAVLVVPPTVVPVEPAPRPLPLPRGSRG